MKKKNENKGFTLVELIVVLVILAILAAILVPALLGYIDRARNQQVVLNAKSALTSAQAELSSMYGKRVEANATNLASGTDYAKRIMNTADVPKCTSFVIGTGIKGDLSGKADATDEHAKYTIRYAKYTESNVTLYFNGQEWVETEPTTYASYATTFTIK